MVPEQVDILMQLEKKNLDICSGQNQIIRCYGVEILHEMPEWGYWAGRSKDFFPEISKNKQPCLIGKVSRAC